MTWCLHYKVCCFVAKKWEVTELMIQKSILFYSCSILLYHKDHVELFKYAGSLKAVLLS